MLNLNLYINIVDSIKIKNLQSQLISNSLILYLFNNKISGYINLGHNYNKLIIRYYINCELNNLLDLINKSDKLLEEEDKKQALKHACEYNNYKIVKRLIIWYKVNKYIIFNDNYIFKYASRHGYTKIIKFLIKIKKRIRFSPYRFTRNNTIMIYFNPSANNDYSITRASRYGHDKIVIELINYFEDMYPQEYYTESINRFIRYIKKYHKGEILNKIKLSINISYFLENVESKHWNYVKRNLKKINYY